MTTGTDITATDTFTCEDGHEHPIPDFPALMGTASLVIAEAIAGSRYTAWNARADATPWEEFVLDDAHQDEASAYVQDGLRDAHAVLERLRGLDLIAFNAVGLAALTEETGP